MVFTKREIKKWVRKFPLLDDIMNLHPVVWINPNLKGSEELAQLPLNRKDIEEAEELWLRFAPFLENAFPETKKMNGIIESPLIKIPQMKMELAKASSTIIKGDLYLKCDNELPIAGSIKARGGVYEVLYFAESIAKRQGLIDRSTNYSQFANEEFKRFFQQYTIGVGSTGNLGLSIGIISSKLGFNVSVYMSKDAKQWKKDLLRKMGVKVLEFSGEFVEAIKAGRQETLAKNNGYFVDDEDSKHLFLGYSVAALRLQKQLEENGVMVDAEHPLVVYLPCGVGGSPGGITFGLKQVFGDHVHCFFVEPTHSPAVLIGLLTGEMGNVCVQDFGIDNLTEADGLAVGRPSIFATAISNLLISGIYTIEDNELFKLLYQLGKTENIFVEPSATAGLIGPIRILQSVYMKNKNLKNMTHVSWATGGALVPLEEMKKFYVKGKELL